MKVSTPLAFCIGMLIGEGVMHILDTRDAERNFSQCARAYGELEFITPDEEKYIS